MKDDHLMYVLYDMILSTATIWLPDAGNEDNENDGGGGLSLDIFKVCVSENVTICS